MYICVHVCVFLGASARTSAHSCAYVCARILETERPRVSVVSVYARIYVFSLESVGGCYCCYCCFCLYYRLSALLCLFSFARSIVISSSLEFKHPCQMSREKKAKMKLGHFQLGIEIFISTFQFNPSSVPQPHSPPLPHFF